ALTSPGGALSVVLQLPGESEPHVGASAFRSMQELKSHFNLISPDWLRETLAARGLRLVYESRRTVAGGKAFWMGIFAKH
ncbi:MAG TPA: hypothetical protein VGL53_18900, partial [Bryobacteraceae bacterium]